MNKKQKAKELLSRLNRLQRKDNSKIVGVAQTLIDEVTNSVNASLADGPLIGTVEKLAKDYYAFKGDSAGSIENILEQIRSAEEQNDNSFLEFAEGLETRLEEVLSQIREVEKRGGEDVVKKSEPLNEAINTLFLEFEAERSVTVNKSSLLEAEVSRISQSLLKPDARYATPSDVQAVSMGVQKSVSDTKSLILELEKTLNKRIASISRGGNGNMNRNIAIGGNQSVLSQFTDINLKPGSNVLLSYTNNQATGFVDVTISATGGAGTSRSISTVAVSSVVADTASTDIVVLASAGIQLTLPTAVANTNLYTIKNVGNSSVLISTTGGQTIDTDTTVIMPVKFTSVDLISDGTNWNIT